MNKYSFSAHVANKGKNTQSVRRLAPVSQYSTVAICIFVPEIASQPTVLVENSSPEAVSRLCHRCYLEATSVPAYLDIVRT